MLLKHIMLLRVFNISSFQHIKLLYIDNLGLYEVLNRALDNDKDEKIDFAAQDNFHGNFDDSMQKIETIESVDSENMSPRSKQIHKIVKRVSEHFKKHGECPATTIDFYKIGKCIGRGAFGKVNLAVQKLTQTLVAVKSINKQYLNDECSRRKVMQEVYILK